MAAPVANSNSSSNNPGTPSADPGSSSTAPATKEGATTDTPPPHHHHRSHHPLSPRTMASQQEIWKLEQYVVGALVRVDPDPPLDPSILPGHNHHGFHLVRDDHRDVFSFSTAPELYGGVDVSFPTNSTTNKCDDDEVDGGDAVAVYVVVDRRTMQVVYHDHLFFTLEVPYVPGFLAFREIEPLQILVQRQMESHPAMTPKAILVDGNGILHPRHAGIACFLGTRTDIPTIGIGKSLLYEGGWTRESVDAALDQFIQHVHTTIGCQDNRDLAVLLARFRGLIVKDQTSSSTRSSNRDNPAMMDDGDVTMAQATDSDSSRGSQTIDRKRVLLDLAPFCNGLAIPLTVDDISNDSKPRAMDNAGSTTNASNIRFPVLGCALVGHGGQIAATNHSTPLVGSSKPIFVSVGHKISLQEAVRVSASLSMSRIPEPIRKADLYGRALMRQRASQATTTTTGR